MKITKYLLPFICLFLGCTTQKSGFKVAATAVPHAELLEFIKPTLQAQGIDLEILVMDDYNIPNRALANHEVEANFFQHLPFMDEQIKQFHYQIESLAAIELEPMGLYSKKIHSLEALPLGATLAIPNDPSNEARALLLLEHHEVIQLDSSNPLQLTPLNITHNPNHLKFIEVDAAMLPRILDEVEAAVINTNYALEANLSPLKDALILESKDSPYANIIAIRKGEENNPQIKALKEAMTSEKMREFILNKYHGAILPAF